MTNQIARDVTFLEATAKAMPNKDITYRRALVVMVDGSFEYYERFDGGSVRKTDRGSINALMAR